MCDRCRQSSHFPMKHLLELSAAPLAAGPVALQQGYQELDVLVGPWRCMCWVGGNPPNDVFVPVQKLEQARAGVFDREFRSRMGDSVALEVPSAFLPWYGSHRTLQKAFSVGHFLVLLFLL